MVRVPVPNHAQARPHRGNALGRLGPAYTMQLAGAPLKVTTHLWSTVLLVELPARS